MASSISADPRWARWVASGLGSGRLPRAPGSWGSLAAAVLVAPCVLDGEAAMLAGWAAGALGLGMAACARLDAVADDPGWVVIDEWAGVWAAYAVAAAFGAQGWAAWWLGLVLFRVLDIAKPWPVARVEHWGAPWWSIMADDLVAGILAGALTGLAFAAGFG